VVIAVIPLRSGKNIKGIAKLPQNHAPGMAKNPGMIS